MDRQGDAMDMQAIISTIASNRRTVTVAVACMLLVGCLLFAAAPDAYRSNATIVEVPGAEFLKLTPLVKAGVLDYNPEYLVQGLFEYLSLDTTKEHAARNAGVPPENIERFIQDVHFSADGRNSGPAALTMNAYGNDPVVLKNFTWTILASANVEFSRFLKTEVEKSIASVERINRAMTDALRKLIDAKREAAQRSRLARITALHEETLFKPDAAKEREIEVLRARKNDDPYIEDLPELVIQLHGLEQKEKATDLRRLLDESDLGRGVPVAKYGLVNPSVTKVGPVLVDYLGISLMFGIALGSSAALFLHWLRHRPIEKAS